MAFYVFDRFTWSVATRGLRHNRSQTLLAMGVVGMSVTLIVFLGSLIDGLQTRIINSVTGSIAHVEIEPRERAPRALWEIDPQADDPGVLRSVERPARQQRQPIIEDWSLWVERVAQFDARIETVTPIARGEGFVSRGEVREAVRLLGVVPERHNEVVDIESNVEGRFIGLGASEVAIGRAFARELDVALGDRIQIASSMGNAASFSVVGIFDTGYAQIDTGTVFMTLRAAQSLLALGQAVNVIGLTVDDVFEAEAVAATLGPSVPYTLTTWMDDNESTLSALRAQGQSSNMIIVFTTIAAGFAIASILVMLVVSKLREVGILKAMGATRRQITAIFALQGTLMSAMGAVVGLALGTGLSLLITLVRNDAGDQVFPIEISAKILVLGFGAAVLVGLVASLYPARRAAKVDPIEVIRGT